MRHINITRDKATVLVEQNTMSLFETIERFMKVTEMVRTSLVNKATGLSYVDKFLKKAMKKFIFYIQLEERPILRNNQTESMQIMVCLTAWLNIFTYLVADEISRPRDELYIFQQVIRVTFHMQYLFTSNSVLTG